MAPSAVAPGSNVSAFLAEATAASFRTAFAGFFRSQILFAIFDMWVGACLQDGAQMVRSTRSRARHGGNEGEAPPQVCTSKPSNLTSDYTSCPVELFLWY